MPSKPNGDEIAPVKFALKFGGRVEPIDGAFDPREDAIGAAMAWLEGYDFRLQEADRAGHYPGATEQDYLRTLAWAHNPRADRQIEAFDILLGRIRQHPRPPYPAELLIMEHARLMDIPPRARLQSRFFDRMFAWVDRVESFLKLNQDRAEGNNPAHLDPETIRRSMVEFTLTLIGLRSAWLEGDRQSLRLISGGMEPHGGAYETLMRQDYRSEVGRLLRKLREQLAPCVLPGCDPALRDRVSKFLRLLDLDSQNADSFGELTTRWRQSWGATELDAELEDLSALLRARGDAIVIESSHVKTNPPDAITAPAGDGQPDPPTQAPLATSEDPDIDWKDIQRRLVALRDMGDRYPRTKALTERFKCGRATISKAFNLMDPANPGAMDILRGWRARHAGVKAPPPAATLDALRDEEVAEANYQPTAYVLPADDVDRAMREPMEQADEEKQAALVQLDAAGRQRIAAAYYEHKRDARDEPSSLAPDGNRPKRVRSHKLA